VDFSIGKLYDKGVRPAFRESIPVRELDDENMRAIFLNTHSFLNSGDAAIVVAQMQLLKRTFPGIKIAMTSRTAEIDKKSDELKNARVFFPLIPAPSVFDGSFQKIQQSLKNLLALNEKKRLIQEIKNSDVVISSGGGYFYSNRKIVPGPMFLQNYLHIKTAQIFRKDIVYFPQSFGPFYDFLSLTMLRDILAYDRTIKIFARERSSFVFLRSLLATKKNRDKVDICPDMTFSLRAEDGSCDPVSGKGLPRPLILLTLRRWDYPGAKSAAARKKNEERYLSAMEKACYSLFKERGGTLAIVPQVRGPGFFENDRIISLKLWKKLKKTIPGKNLLFVDLPDFVSPHYVMRIFSQADLVLATRFHSAIFALISGVPVISITYQPKSEGIMRMLDLAHFCMDIEETDSARIIGLAKEIFRSREEIKRKIEKGVENFRVTIEKKMDGILKNSI
jgi:colanic acid/amylovoran biosynthesis protein